MDDQLQLLLTEFRAFRDTEWREFRESVSAWQQETGERVAELESQMRDLYGNGQPGRVSRLESKTDKHSRVIWLGMGAWTVINTIIAYFCRLHL